MSDVTHRLTSPHVALQSAQQMDAAERVCVCVCVREREREREGDGIFQHQTQDVKNENIDVSSIDCGGWEAAVGGPLSETLDGDRNDKYGRRSSRETEAVLPA